MDSRQINSLHLQIKDFLIVMSKIENMQFFMGEELLNSFCSKE